MVTLKHSKMQSVIQNTGEFVFLGPQANKQICAILFCSRI